jgi:hypothetical protein
MSSGATPLVRDFIVELGFGSTPDLTSATFGGRQLLESRQPMIDIAKFLRGNGGDVGDCLRFTRDGRNVGLSRIAERRDSPTPAPTASAYRRNGSQ